MKKIIPLPNGSYDKQEGCYEISNLTDVNIGRFSKNAICAFALRLGVDLTITHSDDAALFLHLDETLKAEEYKLYVSPSGIKVIASSDTGVIWALASLYLLRKENVFPCVTIEDSPKYSHRGFMLDCARHFFPIDLIKEIIEQNALVKLNVFHWHLTDDQGWRIESKIYPKLHEKNGQSYYTQEEIKEVVAFAAVRGVEVIPEIDMPGHTLAAIAAYPELSCRGEEVEPAKTAGIFNTILCAGKDNTYSFIYELLDEICPLFESDYFHIGGDEAPKEMWKNCPYCQAKLKSIDSSDFEELQGYFTKDVGSYLEKKGKTVIAWNDVLKGNACSDSMAVQYWLEKASENNIGPFLENKGKLIVSDMFTLYFDYNEYFTSLKRVYEYTATSKNENIAANENVMGLEACLWSERVADKETLYKLIYPRLIAFAEVAWTYERDYEDFLSRLELKLPALTACGISYLPVELSNPDEMKRLVAIKQFLSAFAQASSEGSAPALAPEEVGQFLSGFNIKIPE